ncbi:MAG TPA: ABC transporter permease, partial [Nitrospira sp.]|nr:ABC transporter permease [Nitrospira sp.]
MKMKHLTNIVRLGIKELYSLRQDTVLLMLIGAMFTVVIYSSAQALSRELRNASIAIVDEDHSPLSGRIFGAFYPPYFQYPRSISKVEIDPGLDSGRYSFVLDIPPSFQEDVLARRQPTIQINIDATRMSQAYIGQNYIRGIVTGQIDEFVQR